MNGAAEKALRDAWDGIRIRLYESCRPLREWGEAYNHYCFHHNVLPCYANPGNMSPWEMRYGTPPDLSRLHAFGELCYVRLPDSYRRSKLQPRGVPGIMMGYEDALGTKAWRIWVPSLHKIIVTRDAVFMGRMYSTSAPPPDVSLLSSLPPLPAAGAAPTQPPPPPPSTPSQVSSPALAPPSPARVDVPSAPTTSRAAQCAPSPLPSPTVINSRPAQCAPPPLPSTQSVPLSSAVNPAPTPTPPHPATPKVRVSRPVYAPVPFTMNTRGRKRSRDAVVAAISCSPAQINAIRATLAHLFKAQAHDSNSASTDAYTPTSYSDACRCPDATKWQEGMLEELLALKALGTFELIKLEQLPPGANIVSARWVFKPKLNAMGLVVRYKARIVARGFSGKYGVDYTDTYSPVAGASTVRLFMSIVAFLGLEMRYVDFKTAFLNAKVPDNIKIFVKPPPGCECPQGYVWRLRSYLYGLKDASLQWHRVLISHLQKLGLKQCVDDPCLLFLSKPGLIIIVVCIVDDLLIASNNHGAIMRLVKSLQSSFSVKDLGAPSYVVGIHLQRLGAHHIRLSQTLYISQIAKRFGQSKSKNVNAPWIKDLKLSARQAGDGSKPCEKNYRALIGALLYTTLTRPDIAVAVSMLSQFLSDPSTAHWKAAIRVLRYIHTTKTLSLNFNPDKNTVKGTELVAYSDASFDSDRSSSRSRTGYVILFAGCPFIWASRLQPVVALSSAESEYIALARCASEVVWARRVVRDLGFPQSQPTTILVDNKSTIAMSGMVQCKSRTKHILRRFHWVREAVRAGTVRLQHVPSAQNLADFFTKIVAKVLFGQFLKFFLQ